MSVGQPAPADDHLVWQGPHSDRLLLDVAECWQYRDLLGIFVGRDLKVRYRQAVVGVLWVLVQPVVMLSVALFFYMQVGKQDQPPVTVGVPYAISGLCGLILYQLFMAGVRDGANSVVLARAMLTKIYRKPYVVPEVV